jgi:hypothetical protein
VKSGELRPAGAGPRRKTPAAARESPLRAPPDEWRRRASGAFSAARSLPKPALEGDMCHSLRVALSASVLVVGAALAAAAQSTPVNWEKGTALGVFGGAATAGGGTDGASGVSIGWELTPYFTFEGSGTWLGGGIDAFNGLIGPRVHLLSRRTLVPFVSGAVGMQHATVDMGAPVPEFYRRRMGTMDERVGFPMQRTFNDLVLSVGTGLDIYLQRHLALRPDVRVLFVRDDGARTVTVYGVHLAYHFEEHPITP